MKCIFCKSPSSGCMSKEHIMPESLGNTDHILPPGWVCDDCNNYIAREVEAPFLNSWYGRNSRFEMRVPSKRGRIPPAIGLHAQSLCMIDIYDEGGGNFAIKVAPREDASYFARTIHSQTHGSLIIPAATNPPKNYETSRFIAKIALEVLAYRCAEQLAWNEEIVNMRELDDIRNYVRRGRPGFVWPIHTRRIYAPDWLFAPAQTLPYEVLHEWDILPIALSDGSKVAEFYVVIAIFGMEYTINLGGPELNGYHRWLKTHQNCSYLYSKGESYRSSLNEGSKTTLDE